MSLYRTYRPRTFADVTGQDHVVTTLEQAVKQDKLAHAYLFAGSRGTGKTSVARILAAAIMTRGLPDETLRRQIEEGVREGSLVDFLEIDAASNRGIDDVRDLIEKIQFSPVVAAAKVYVIDEVHMLSKEAFNALLKTLEEPPPYAYFILATTELHKIPATIQSRCQCFPFRRIRDEDTVRRLQFIADSEKVKVDREALRAITLHAQGSLRDAISLLDQMRSLPEITLEDVQSRIGATGHDAVDPTLAAIEAGNQAEVIEIVGRLEAAGIPLDTFLRLLLQRVRDTLHEAVAAGGSIATLERQLTTFLAAVRDVRHAPVPGLVLEAALLSLCDTTGSESKSAGASRGRKRELTETAPAAKAEEVKSIEMPPLAAKGTFEAKPVTLATVLEEWAEVVRQAKPSAVRMSLKDAQVTGVAGGVVTLAFASAFHRDRVAGTEDSRAIEAILADIFHQPLKLVCELGGPRPKPAADQEAVNLAEAAAEIF